MNWDDSNRVVWFKAIMFLIAIILGFANALRAQNAEAVWGEDRSYQGWITRDGAIWSADGSYSGFVTRQNSFKKCDEDWSNRGRNRMK